jgi:hypothetical protein
MKERIKSNKKIIVASGIILLCVFLVIAIVASQRNTHTTDSNSQNLSQQPEYSTILPNGRGISELGGWRRVSPTNSEPVYAYNDTVQDTEVMVSQQELPENFSSDPKGQLKELANSGNATEEFSAGNTTVYIGTNSEGPQSLYFVKADLLVLIKSTDTLSNDAWSEYIQSLN